MRALRALPPGRYLVRVKFDDVAKPETVRLVDPADLAATFGTGVRLRGMTFEMMEEAVTEGARLVVRSRWQLSSAGWQDRGNLG